MLRQPYHSPDGASFRFRHRRGSWFPHDRSGLPKHVHIAYMISKFLSDLALASTEYKAPLSLTIITAPTVFDATRVLRIRLIGIAFSITFVSSNGTRLPCLRLVWISPSTKSKPARPEDSCPMHRSYSSIRTNFLLSLVGFPTYTSFNSQYRFFDGP